MGQVKNQIKDNQSIYLSDFVPTTELVLETHQVNYPKFECIDFHTHLGRMLLGDNYASKYDTADMIKIMKEYGIKGIVNLDGENGVHFDNMRKKTNGYEDFIYTFGTVDISRFEQSDFEKYVYHTIKELCSSGIRGLKFWKILGLQIKDQKGKYLRVDDERLKVVWQTAAEFDLPIMIHIADPTAFFKPIDCYNERYEELHSRLDWSFYNKDQYSFYELMRMQENLLAANPETTFIVAHCCSYSENLSVVSNWLDTFDNLYTDFADRINDLGRQPYTSKKFLEKHQNRVLFGTDLPPTDLNRYPIYYRFLETMDEYFDYSTKQIPPQGRWKIYGVGLSDKALKKIYFENAKKLLKI